MNIEPYFVPGVIVVMVLFLAALGVATYCSRDPR